MLICMIVIWMMLHDLIMSSNGDKTMLLISNALHQRCRVTETKQRFLRLNVVQSRVTETKQRFFRLNVARCRVMEANQRFFRLNVMRSRVTETKQQRFLRLNVVRSRVKHKAKSSNGDEATIPSTECGAKYNHRIESVVVKYLYQSTSVLLSASVVVKQISIQEHDCPST